MRNSAKLRSRALVLILPIVSAIVIQGGLLTAFTSQNALERLATRLMAYKAEQLRDYAHSQWDVMVELELDEEIDYRKAAEAAIQSYAGSLVRTNSELIFAINDGGEVALATAPVDAQAAVELGRTVGLGWLAANLGDEARVGQAFRFEPFAWTVYLTELRSEFYLDIRQIGLIQFVTLIVAIIASTLLLSILVGYILRPIEQLSQAMRGVSAAGNLGLRVPEADTEEVATLGREFNAMLGSLQVTHQRLEDTAAAEARARATADERELETLLVLGRATEFRDTETGEHLTRVGRLSGLFAGYLGLGEGQQDLIVKSSPLHDVGKIGISDVILLKPGPLTKEERSLIKQHTTIGWRVLKDADSIYLATGATIALTHHEYWNGAGYPEGLAGEEIPIEGRIVAIVDVFDALTSRRPYKEPWSAAEAAAEIISQRGTQFDPQLVEIFSANLEEFTNVVTSYRGSENSE